jgi:uncharacterized repeat protein (TIGR01451 family)
VDPSDNLLTDSDMSHYVGSAIEITKQTNGQDATEPTGPFIPVGDTVTWTYRVTNPSLVDLTDVSVEDDDLPIGVDIIRLSDETGDNDDILEPGEVWLYEAVGQSQFGQFMNVGTVTARDPSDNLLEASYTSHYFGTSILIQKETNGEDADDPTGPLIPVGNEVTWTYRVTNPNPIDLFDVQVADDTLPSDVSIIRLEDESGNNDNILDPGEVWVYEAIGTAQLGQYVNTGVVTAVDSNENAVEDSDDSHYLGTAIDLEKSTNDQDADLPTGPAVPVGEPVVWDYRVSNPSLVALTNVVVVDPDLPVGVAIDRQPDETGNNDDILDPGEVWVFRAASESVLGQFSNTGTARATDPVNNLLTDSDASHYVGTDVELQKLTNGEDAPEPTGPIIRVGDPVVWTYRVTNPSPVSLTDVSVADPDLPDGVSIIRQPDEVGNNDNFLDPNEIWIFEASSIVPEERQYQNTGLVEALDPSNNLLTDTDISHHFGKNIAGLTGFVYIDLNDNGEREPGEGGVPGILVTLEGVSDEDTTVGPVTIMTDDDGSYAFIDIPPGVYELTERQPFALIDGKDTIGDLGGEVEDNRFFNIVVPVNVIGEEYNFGELGLKPEFVSKRLFFASSFPIEWYFREVVANGEEQHGNEYLAAAIRTAAIPSTVTAPPEAPAEPEPPAPTTSSDTVTVINIPDSNDFAEEQDSLLVEDESPVSEENFYDQLALLSHDDFCLAIVPPVDNDVSSNHAAEQPRPDQSEISDASPAPDQPPLQAATPAPAPEPVGPKPAGDAFQMREAEYLRALDEILATEDWAI